MTIREIYEKSVEGGYEWLTLLIELIVIEKKVVRFDDTQEVLNLYFKSNNQMRMNELLFDYREKVKGDWSNGGGSGI